MTNSKKTHPPNIEDETQEQEASQVEAGREVESAPELTETETVSREEYEQLQMQLEQVEAKAAENLDGWQRAQAEFANFKKRLERDREVAYASMKGDIIRKILPVLDDLERALQNHPSDSAPDSWVNGIELIYRKLESILEAEGVTRMQVEGQLFDPNFHEAITHEESDEHQSGQIISVVQHGYLLGERVIRPALVRVAK
jgi:molecular chaperone GrpE